MLDYCVKMFFGALRISGRPFRFMIGETSLTSPRFVVYFVL
jgi:hypothetical protein